MAKIDVFASDFEREVAKEPAIALVNRFAENNPTLTDSQVSLIARPAMKKFAEVGVGPVRKLFSEPGVFDGDLFAVSGQELYRVSSASGVATLVGNLTAELGDVSMAATAPIEDEPAHLFITDGGVLWLYLEEGGSLGHLEASGSIANTDVVRIDGTYYEWTNGSVDAGTPLGTSGDPWLVEIGISNSEALNNLFNAINNTGLGGTDYSTALTAHTTVRAVSVSSNDLYVRAIVPGVAGDSIVTTETGANIAWDAGTLQNGGDPQLLQVTVPDDVGAIAVAHINSYVIVVPIQDEDTGTVGRFYWVEPGEIIIDPLNFATAERAPDKIQSVMVYGDLFWLCGQKTVEPWQTTGNLASPMLRYQGILFDRGSWEGTAVQVKDSFIIVDEDGKVFQSAGTLQEISTPAVTEKIRKAIQRQSIG